MRETEIERSVTERAAHGDHAAFEQIVRDMQQPVYNLALRMSGDAEEAYDLAQETFLKVWNSLPYFRYDCAVSSWIYRLTSNTCIDFLRKKKKSDTVSLHFVTEDGEQTLPIPDPTPGPEERAMDAVNREQIARAINSLETEYRMALTMRVLDGMRYQEIAEALEISEGTVKSRIARARAKMRAALGNILDGASSNEKEAKMHEL